MQLMIQVWRMVKENCAWQKMLKRCVWRVISNHAPDVIFCDHALDMQYESGYVLLAPHPQKSLYFFVKFQTYPFASLDNFLKIVVTADSLYSRH